MAREEEARRLAEPPLGAYEEPRVIERGRYVATLRGGTAVAPGAGSAATGRFPPSPGVRANVVPRIGAGGPVLARLAEQTWARSD